MPDILIRGMEMPTSCADCPIKGDAFCRLTREKVKYHHEYRHDRCPLRDLPKHGDLIERDEIVEHYRKCERNLGSDRHLEFLTVHDWIEEAFVYDLLNAPVIVP